MTFEPTADPTFRHRILFVDDDLGMRILATEALEGAGFQVMEASSGEEALSLLQEGLPDAVLLDVIMSGIDGYETCRQLRLLPGGASTPVLIMTGLDDEEAIEEAYRAGATDFITKPIHYALLAHRLRYLMRASGAFREVRETAEQLARTQRLARLTQWQMCLRTGRFRWSDETATIFGLPPLSRVTSLDALTRWVHPEDRARVETTVRSGEAHRLEYRLKLPDGTERIIHQEAERITDERTGAMQLVGAVQDVTEWRLAERQVTKLAYFDSLTGLPNRAYLGAYVREAVAGAERHGHSMAVLALDLDLFKRVNDMLGHAAGDALLVEVASRLADSLCGGEGARPWESRTDASGGSAGILAARLGGDEFIVVLGRVRSPEEAAVVARRILDKLACSYQLEGTEVFVSSSIGIATYPENGRDVETLFENADAALYHAKDSGRNNFQFYSPVIHEKARRRVELEQGLRAALGHGIVSGNKASESARAQELHLAFQPKVLMPSGRVVGVEALLRWTSPTLGVVPPVELIPVAEDTGLIVPLGEWVLRTACTEAKRWMGPGKEELAVAVNVSSRQFREPGFAARVGEILQETGFPPRLLEIEITEGVVMQDTAASHRTLSELKAIGTRIALDDFGTGYSSLSYLTRFAIDILKIDRSFIKGLGAKGSEAIISAIIALSRSLRLDLVAEGVETEEQVAFLETQGAIEIQGYYFAKPMSAEALEQWLALYEQRRLERPEQSIRLPGSLRPTRWNSTYPAGLQ